MTKPGQKKGVNQHSRTRGQNDPVSKSHETAKKIASQVGKSEKTVRRYAKEVEAIEKAGKIKEYGEGKLSKQEVKEILEKAGVIADAKTLLHKKIVAAADDAIKALERIPDDYIQKTEALNKVKTYCENRLKQESKLKGGA